MGKFSIGFQGGDVFSPITYMDKDTQYLNKIPSLAIGEFDGKHGTIHGELIFTVK